ncbi:MAG TPA: hypothetical protein VOA88_08445 [Candidatus Dormibacteraeota bacterium]|nr:hypothetical protein [Candidatus Dormibacteraeota bacterium]
MQYLFDVTVPASMADIDLDDKAVPLNLKQEFVKPVSEKKQEPERDNFAL